MPLNLMNHTFCFKFVFLFITKIKSDRYGSYIGLTGKH